jgi:hypothetical protein
VEVLSVVLVGVAWRGCSAGAARENPLLGDTLPAVSNATPLTAAATTRAPDKSRVDNLFRTMWLSCSGQEAQET